MPTKRVKQKVLKLQPRKEASILSEQRTVPPEEVPCPYPVNRSFLDYELLHRK